MIPALHCDVIVNAKGLKADLNNTVNAGDERLMITQFLGLGCFRIGYNRRIGVAADRHHVIVLLDGCCIPF